MPANTPVLALTPGEPAGIGPECTIKLAVEHPELRLLVVADPALLTQTAQQLDFLILMQMVFMSLAELVVPLHLWILMRFLTTCQQVLYTLMP